MVVDTSVLLAVYFEEANGEWASEQLREHADKLFMSTVNLTETLIKLRDRERKRYAELETSLFNTGIRFVAPTVAQAVIAAEARLKYPLNLGDCFAYALAVTENDSLLTLDADFKSLDVTVVLP